jgi:hypothetical protein
LREPASHFFVRTNVAWPHSFGRLDAHRRAEFRVHFEIERKDPSMPTQRIVLGLAIAIGATGAIAPASSQEYRGTWEQQMACTPDVWRLCSDQIPDADRIVTCLRQNAPQLSSNCRAVFKSSANAQPAHPRTPQQAARAPQQQAAPRARAAPPVQAAPVQPRPYDDAE